MKELFLNVKPSGQETEDFDQGLERIKDRFLKTKMFSKFLEINTLEQDQTLNFLGEELSKSEKSSKMSIEDIIDIDPKISERFVFKFNKCKN